MEVFRVEECKRRDRRGVVLCPSLGSGGSDELAGAPTPWTEDRVGLFLFWTPPLGDRVLAERKGRGGGARLGPGGTASQPPAQRHSPIG